ncbi:Kalirin [Manis pentadactyla]|nr:Kalirin [Manis pentadactyla]
MEDQPPGDTGSTSPIQEPEIPFSGCKGTPSSAITYDHPVLQVRQFQPCLISKGGVLLGAKGPPRCFGLEEPRKRQPGVPGFKAPTAHPKRVPAPLLSPGSPSASDGGKVTEAPNKVTLICWSSLSELQDVTYQVIVSTQLECTQDLTTGRREGTSVAPLTSNLLVNSAPGGHTSFRHPHLASLI